MIKDYKNIVKSKNIELIKKCLENIKRSIEETRKEIKVSEELIALDMRDKKYLEAELLKLKEEK